MASSLKKLIENGLIWYPEESRYKKERLSLGPHTGSHGTTSAAARFGISAVDSALPDGGLSLNSIHEFLVGTIDPIQHTLAPPLRLITNIIVNTITEQTSYALWIGRGCWPTPFSIQASNTTQHDILSRCIFVDPPSYKQSLWATETALRHSDHIGIVVCSLHKASFTTSRRLSLAANRGKCIGICIRSSKEQNTPSTARTRWLITPIHSPHPYPHWQLQLLSCKGPQPSKKSWVVCFNNELFQEAHEQTAQTDPSSVPSQKIYTAA